MLDQIDRYVSKLDAALGLEPNMLGPNADGDLTGAGRWTGQGNLAAGDCYPHRIAVTAGDARAKEVHLR